MESESSRKNTTIPNRVWKLRRYGRFLPRGKAKSRPSGGNSAWKIFESSEGSGQLELNILGSAHLLVSQGQELLEGFSLLNAQSFLKIQHKSDTVLFNVTIKGESRLFRLQFDGSSQAEAAGFCSEAVEMLKDRVPVQEHLSTDGTSAAPSNTQEPGTSAAPSNTQEPGTSAAPSNTQEPGTSAAPSNTEEPGTSAAPSNTQEPGTSAAPSNTQEPGTSAAPSNTQEPGTSAQQWQGPEGASQATPAIATGRLSIQHLSQHFLGERELSLPMAYHQSTLPSGGLEALLRLCLLDSGFPAFVEEVEKKLKELMDE